VSCRALLPIQSLSQCLEISNGTRKARVPWTRLQKAQADYIEPKYLPKRVTLKQYYHLTRQDVNAILKHWTRRQAAGKVPFCFRRAVQENSDASDESNADSDSDICPSEEAEEDSQGDNVSQARGDGASRGDSGVSSSTDQPSPPQSAGNAAENSQPGEAGDAAENAQPSEAGDAYLPQQTSGDVAILEPHIPPPHESPLPRPRPRPRPRARPLPRPHNRPLADGSQSGQTDGAPTEGRLIESGSAGREPSFNDEVSNLDHHTKH
jgi:hypothetical protein